MRRGGHKKGSHDPVDNVPVRHAPLSPDVVPKHGGALDPVSTRPWPNAGMRRAATLPHTTPRTNNSLNRSPDNTVTPGAESKTPCDGMRSLQSPMSTPRTKTLGTRRSHLKGTGDMMRAQQGGKRVLRLGSQVLDAVHHTTLAQADALGVPQLHTARHLGQHLPPGQPWQKARCTCPAAVQRPNIHAHAVQGPARGLQDSEERRRPQRGTTASPETTAGHPDPKFKLRGGIELVAGRRVLQASRDEHEHRVRCVQVRLASGIQRTGVCTNCFPVGGPSREHQDPH